MNDRLRALSHFAANFFITTKLLKYFHGLTLTVRVAGLNITAAKSRLFDAALRRPWLGLLLLGLQFQAAQRSLQSECPLFDCRSLVVTSNGSKNQKAHKTFFWSFDLSILNLDLSVLFCDQQLSNFEGRATVPSFDLFWALTTYFWVFALKIWTIRAPKS